MRSIEPFPYYPPTLDVDESGGKATAKNLQRYLSGHARKMTFPTSWNKEDVRGFLYASQWRVCAYCSRDLPGNDRGDVEHFRPKAKVVEAPDHGGYWWLAYRVANYVLSCGVCNSTRKGNRFPVKPASSRATYDGDPDCVAEEATLLHPKYDDFDRLFAVDLNSRRAEVLPAPGISGRTLERVNHHIEFYRINTDQHLIRERTDVLDAASEALEAEDFDRASSLAVRFNRQSLVARQLLKNVAPDHLPDEDYELGWLLGRIIREFDILTSVLVDYPDDRSELELEETIWALSTLLATKDKAKVNSVCSKLGILGDVQDRAGKLRSIPVA